MKVLETNLKISERDLKAIGGCFSGTENKGKSGNSRIVFYEDSNYQLEMIILRNILEMTGHKILSQEEYVVEVNGKEEIETHVVIDYPAKRLWALYEER